MPESNIKTVIAIIILMLFLAVLTALSVEAQAMAPIKFINRNRLIDSFTDEECHHFLHFDKPELRRLLELIAYPDVDIVCPYGTRCPFESAFYLIFYRLAYPNRLVFLQDIFGREYLQIFRIFKATIN